MIPSCIAGSIIHALLHYSPVAFFGKNERMQVNLEAILYGIVIYFGGELAITNEQVAVEAGSFCYGHQFRRCLAGVFAFASADVETEFCGAFVDGAFQSTHYRSCDA